MKRRVYHTIIKPLLKGIVTIVLVAIMAIIATSISPIYNFPAAQPFSGPDIFNPYSNIDSVEYWKRANFHTHTRVEGILNECELWPQEVWEEYAKFGYDIVTFSNHNELTTHPFDARLQINLYEHGYNLLKFHKLVFGAKEVSHFDHLLPILPSQRQFQLDILGEQSDIIQFNHPLRTHLTTKQMMQLLEGYELIELDSGRSTTNEYWDWALSAGRYSFATLNDDLHYPDRSSRFAIRTTYLGAKSATTEDIIATLRSGCFYSVRVPDYGAGDWSVKREANMTLPKVVNIGACGDTLFMRLSSPAEQIRVIGQDHSLLSRATHSDSIVYVMRGGDAYARFVASYPDSLIIMSNPFARYDSSRASSPADRSYYVPNIPATVGYNLVVVLLIGGVLYCYVNIVKRWRR